MRKQMAQANLEIVSINREAISMQLTTSRLILREMTDADFDALYSVLADSDIMQHYPYTFDEARVRNWIVRNQERYRIFGFGLWAVCLKETGEMIGDCGLTMQVIHGQIRPEIGYHIRQDAPVGPTATRRRPPAPFATGRSQR